MATTEPNWTEGRRLSKLEWSAIADMPYRVALPSRREDFMRVVAWLQKELMTLEISEAKLFRVIHVGNWYIIGFAQRTHAAMCRLLFGI